MKRIRNKTPIMLSVERINGAELEELLRHMYVDRKLSVEQMTKELHVSYVTVRKWLSLAGIKSRGFNFDKEVNEHGDNSNR